MFCMCDGWLLSRPLLTFPDRLQTREHLAPVGGPRQPIILPEEEIHPRRTDGSGYRQMIVFCCEIYSLSLTTETSSLLDWLVTLLMMISYGGGLKLRHPRKDRAFILRLFKHFLMVIIKNAIIRKYTDFLEKVIIKEYFILKMLPYKKSKNYHWTHLFPI